MDIADPILTRFTTRMHQLILQYKEVVRENGELRGKLSSQEEETRRRDKEIERMKTEYDSLKMARMLTVTEGDVETAKARVSRILRDINRCITLINDQQSKD